MSEARIILSFAMLVVLALLFIERGVSASFAPLVAVSSASLWFSFFGSFGLLLAGGWIYTFLVAAALVWIVYRFAVLKKVPKLSGGFWFFIGASLLFILLLWMKKPMFTTWDEFSFWGTGNKLTKLFNQFYTTAPVGWSWPATQPPALVSFSYCMQFFGSGFSEWQTYAAYDILQFAAFAALLRPFEKKNWQIALPVALLAFISPYLFTLYKAPIKPTSLYLDSLADVPMGVFFGAVLAVYFAAENKSFKELLPAYLALSMLTLMKETGYTFALIAVVLILCDLLFARYPAKISLLKRLRLAAPPFFIGIAIVLGSFLGWTFHLKFAIGVNRTNLGGKQNIGLLELPVVAVKELFSNNKSDKFMEVTQGMPRLFMSEKITLVGTGLMVSVLAIGLCLGAALLTKDRALRRRSVVFSIFAPLGFTAYYAIISLSYIYIFRAEQTFASYERYIYPFYIGWFLASLVLFAIAAKDSKLVAEGKLALLLLGLALGFRVWQVVPPAYSVFGVHQQEYQAQREFLHKAQEITQGMDSNDRVFTVTNDDGLDSLRYIYAFLPIQADHSFGGGPVLEAKEKQEDGSFAKHELSAEEFAEYLIESGCTYLFIDQASDEFVEKYRILFSDGLQDWMKGATGLYSVNLVDGETVLEPVLKAKS